MIIFCNLYLSVLNRSITRSCLWSKERIRTERD